MTTNKEWLFGLPLEEQLAWMNAEHVESPTSRDTAQDGQVHQESGELALESDTAALNVTQSVTARQSNVSESLSDASTDSREKLEADIWHFIEHNGWFGYEYEAESYAECRKAIFDIFKEWLDRQAAITEHEVLSHPDERDEQIAELEETVRIGWECECKLQAERDKSRKDCELYRSLFGKCIDYADAIHALMDEIDEGLA